MRVYMAVTADEYELPLIVCDSAKELAENFGVHTGTVWSLIWRGDSGRNRGFKFIRVEIEED